MITIDTLSLDCEDMLFMLFSVAMLCSTGFVTTVSTCSGLAPAYVVTTTTYGRFTSGSRSGVMRVNATTPKRITSTTATNIVSGFLTLNLSSNCSPPFRMRQSTTRVVLRLGRLGEIYFYCLSIMSEPGLFPNLPICPKKRLRRFRSEPLPMFFYAAAFLAASCFSIRRLRK